MFHGCLAGIVARVQVDRQDQWMTAHKLEIGEPVLFALRAIA